MVNRWREEEDQGRKINDPHDNGCQYGSGGLIIFTGEQLTQGSGGQNDGEMGGRRMKVY